MVEVPSSPQTSPHRWRRGLPALSVAVAVMLMGTAIILAAPGFSLDPFSPGGSISNHYDSPILEGTPALVFPTPTPFNAEPNQALSESAELITADEASTATPTVTSTSTIIPPTASPTRTPTTTFSATPTSTATPDTRTPTATATPSRTPTPSPVLSPSPTPTHTRTPTPSPYLSPTPTHTAAPTATPTPTWTPAPPPPSMGNIPRPHLGYGAFSSVGYASWVRGMGFGWMVWLLDWGLAEPSKGSYNWWALDQVLASAQANGIQVILRIDSSPAWARSGATGSAPPNNLNDLGDFMAAVAQHAGNRVAGYVIWNEPNLSVSWGNQNPDPARYAQMLQAVYSRIKAVAPNAAVITAGMATTGNGGPGAMGDLDFIRGIYQNGGKDYFDVLGSHPYGFASPPEADPNAAWGLAFRRAEQQRQIMVEYGDSYKQVWAIEFNWILDPGGSCAGWGDWPTRWWQRVDEATQADYLVRAYQYAYNNWPWMGVMNVFNLDFATDYWRDYCEPVRWYSLTYRVDHRDPANNPILPRPAYEALAAMPKPA